MINDKRVRVCLAMSAAIFLAATMSSVPVNAQQGEKGAKGALEEVVVTARKREEALLDVPLALTALTSGAIEDKGIVQFKDMVDFTPGFFFSEHTVGRGDRSNRLLVVRGMRITTENDHQQAATVFVDGAPMLGSVIAGLEDAERIEVVRGPQSAYFGRSTFAGAVNVVTKTPGDEFTGKLMAQMGNFAMSNVGLQIEGPLTDKVSYRVSGSQWQTDGHWKNAANPTETLGDRRTTSFAGTLYFHPNDQFSAKLRIHSWRDIDGPSAAFGYGTGQGEQYFNCNPPGSTAVPVNGVNNYICGVAPFPQDSEITSNNILTPDKARLLNGIADPGQNLDSIFVPPFLEGFGFERLADQASLIMDYAFNNGMTLSSITAAHTNDWMALDDLDRRDSVNLPALPGFPDNNRQDVALLNSRELQDFSQEFRLSSNQDARFRWLVGLSYITMEGTRTSGFKWPGVIRSSGIGNTFDIQTTGIFGSVDYDFNDRLTLSVEARQQSDDFTESTTSGAGTVSDTFNSFNPRAILSYSTADDVTVYASYGEGTRPGAFNPALLTASQPVLDALAEFGIGLTVPEEELQMFEVGIKGTLLDGRAQIQAAVYTGDWDAQSSVAVPTPSGFQPATTTGGTIDLTGCEVEGVWAATENLTLEGTFSFNEQIIKKGFPGGCGDCGLLLGQTDVTGLGLGNRGSPETQGSLSATYAGNLNSTYDWYVRGDFIHRGSSYATVANLLETGDQNTVNLRFGIESENLRLEIYSKNLFEDETITQYQYLLDFAYFNPPSVPRFISAGLPEKRTFGLRATYTF
jgi:iron complex outermembrane receptor protein